MPDETAVNLEDVYAPDPAQVSVSVEEPKPPVVADSPTESPVLPQQGIPLSSGNNIIEQDAPAPLVSPPGESAPPMSEPASASSVPPSVASEPSTEVFAPPPQIASSPSSQDGNFMKSLLS